MQECYKDLWVTLAIDEAKGILYAHWHDDGTLTAQQYKHQMLIARSIVEQYRPTKSMNDARKFRLAISPELQTWIGTHVFQKQGHEIIKKYAFIVSDSVFAQVSLEQMMEESQRDHVSRYFDNIKEADAWLNS